MKHRIIFPLFLFLCFLAFSVLAQSSDHRSFQIGEIREIKSTITNKTYELIIKYPDSYQADKEKHYPVVYFCDGYWDFPLLSAIYGNLLYDEKIEECFLVGFSYKGENLDYGPLRQIDYTPKTNNDMNGAGGADQFIEVVEKEFIPFMENNYRIDNSWRALGGSSLGGLFTLYTMLVNPQLFNAYISISPAVLWDNNWLINYEAEFQKKNKELPVTLYMTGAEKEFPQTPQFLASIVEFDKILSKRNYNGFSYKFRMIDDAYHASTKAESYTRGLQHIFDPKLKKTGK